MTNPLSGCRAPTSGGDALLIVMAVPAGISVAVLSAPQKRTQLMGLGLQFLMPCSSTCDEKSQSDSDLKSSELDGTPDRILERRPSSSVLKLSNRNRSLHGRRPWLRQVSLTPPSLPPSPSNFAYLRLVSPQPLYFGALLEHREGLVVLWRQLRGAFFLVLTKSLPCSFNFVAAS